MTDCADFIILGGMLTIIVGALWALQRDDS